MTQQLLPGSRRLDASAVAVVLVATAFALLIALLLVDGGAPVAVGVLAAVPAFCALVGCWRMLGAQPVSRRRRPTPRR